MNSISRRTLALASTLACLAFLACVPAAIAQGSKGVGDKEIRIGILSALTGPVAAYGIAMQAGTGAYFSTVNERGGVNGRRIRLAGEDGAMSTPVSIAAARKLASGDGIFALVNSGATPQVDALRPYLLEQNNVPIFGTYGGLFEWFDPPKKGLYGLPVVPEQQARILGRWTAKEGRRNVLVLHIEAASYLRAAKEVEPGFRSFTAEGGVQLMGVKLPTTDYAPIVFRVAQLKPDALVVILTENETILLAKELQNQNIKVPLYAWTPSVSLKLPELGGSAVEGLKGVSWTPSPLDDSPAVREYREALAKYFPSEKPDFISLYTFGAAKVFVEALSRMKGPVNADELQKALYSMKNFETGILAPVSFSPDRHLGTSGVYQSEIVKGKWQMGPVLDANSLKW